MSEAAILLAQCLSCHRNLTIQTVWLRQPFDPTAICLVRKFISLIHSISEAGLVSTWIYSFSGKTGGSTIVMDQPNCSQNCFAQRSSWGCWEWTTEPSVTRISSVALSFRGPVFQIGEKVAASADSCSLFHSLCNSLPPPLAAVSQTSGQFLVFTRIPHILIRR